MNTVLLSVCIVDAWLLYGGRECRWTMKPTDFYTLLAHQLINDEFDIPGINESDRSRSNISTHITLEDDICTVPTKKVQKTSDVNSTGSRAQRRCRRCHKKKIWFGVTVLMRTKKEIFSA